MPYILTMTSMTRDLSLTRRERALAGVEHGDPLWFDAVLRPHRSLSARGFALLMAGVLLISLLAGLRFYVLGAWPVAAFFALDVALLYGAFKLSYATGRAFESIQITQRELIVTRVDWRGRVRTAVFDPYWARVRLVDGGSGDSRLEITSHGRAIGLGLFLNDSELEDLFDALTRALERHREGQPPVSTSRIE